MSKPSLKSEYRQLASDMIATFLVGHHEYRPDLAYPESHSDMDAGMRALLRMFKVERRPLALDRDDLLEAGKADR
jgi:hypothetical protein